jgi:23S rRNA (guanosine2251-2'-O)-methyltransferase
MKKKKNNSKEYNEMIYGAHSIIEMLKAKRRKLVSIYTTKQLPKSWDRLKRYLPSKISNIQYVDKSVLTRMAGTPDHMGIIAWVTQFKTIKKMFDSKQHEIVLMLDSVQDVGNLGSILRSAYCSGIKGVILCKKNSAPLSPSVFKSSAGFAEHLDIHISMSSKQAVNDIKKAGYNLYLAVVSNNSNKDKIQNAAGIIYKKPLCLVIGNESVGINKDFHKEGTLITIPQISKEVSYNASVAAGILLFSISSNNH